MQFEHTPALTFALHRAAGYARRAGAASVTPLHLLLGLLGEEEGQAAGLLSGSGVDRASARQHLGLIDEAPADTHPMPLHAATQQALARARELARLHAA